MKVFMVIVLTIVMYGIYLVFDRVVQMRRARAELWERRRLWWHTPTREVEKDVEKEADETVYGV